MYKQRTIVRKIEVILITQNIELSDMAQQVLPQINEQIMIGQLGKIAKEIYTDH